MGYAHGTQWNDERVKKEILKIVDVLKINRMPSRKEIETMFGYSLSNRISRSGGFYGWADKLGLEIKISETKLGLEYENVCKTHLESMGMICESTSTKFPYDLFVGRFTKVDVKVSNITNIGSYSCNLEYVYPKSDFVVMYCITDSNVPKVYIIPSYVLKGKKQLSIGLSNSKYDAYLNRWDLIKKHEDCLLEMYDSTKL